MSIFALAMDPVSMPQRGGPSAHYLRDPSRPPALGVSEPDSGTDTLSRRTVAVEEDV